jgi:thiol-disulfide isomerase/thioredoxin
VRRAGIFALGCVLLWSGLSAARAAETPRPFEATSLKALFDDNKGRPLIVHFWGLTCGPCLAELSAWGNFLRTHPDTRIVLVNWDRRGGDPARMAKTLDGAGLGGVASFALGDGFEEKLRFAVDRDWMGELPYTRLVQRDGGVTPFSGAADFKMLERWLAGGAYD